MTNSESFTISNIRGGEINATTSLAAQQGWNVGPHDTECFFAADHDGFFAGKLGNTLVACIFGINYGTGFAYLGRYIVDAQYRGRGYGMKLWETAMHHIGDRPAALNAAPVMEKKYELAGFRTANRGARYTTISHKFEKPPQGIVPLKEVPFGDIRDFDRRFFPANRDNFLQTWLMMPESRGFASVDAKGRVNAYGQIRRFNTGWKIGPLFSTTPEAADLLYEVLQGSVPENEPVVIDIALNNPNATSLASKHSMEKVFENARMYRGQVPDFDQSGIYSFTSQELG